MSEELTFGEAYEIFTKNDQSLTLQIESAGLSKFVKYIFKWGFRFGRSRNYVAIYIRMFEDK